MNREMKVREGYDPLLVVRDMEIVEAGERLTEKLDRLAQCEEYTIPEMRLAVRRAFRQYRSDCDDARTRYALAAVAYQEASA